MQTRDFFDDDHQQNTEMDIMLNDEAQVFADNLEATPYRDKYRQKYTFARVFSQVFPFLSGTTLSLLAFYLIFGSFWGLAEMSAGTIAWNVICVLAALVGIYVVELHKANGLRDYHKNKQTGRRVPGSLIPQVILTSLISILGSGFGSYMLTYDLSDKTYTLSQQSVQDLQGVDGSLANKISQIEQLYLPIIEEKQLAINSFQAGRFRTKRNQLNNELLEITNKMNGEIAAARQAAGEQRTEINTGTQSAIMATQGAANRNGWLGFVFIIVLELVNVWANYFVWKYRANVVKVSGAAPSPSLNRNNGATYGAHTGGLNGHAAHRSNGTYNQIGYRRNGDRSNGADRKDGNRTDGYEIVCDHCGEPAVMKSPKARFCSDSCREKAWEKNTGRILPHKLKTPAE